METFLDLKVQAIHLPHGQAFNYKVSEFLSKLNLYARKLKVNEGLLLKIHSEFAVFQWVTEYHDWLKDQTNAINIFKKNMRHLPKYDHIPPLKSLITSMPAQIPAYHAEGNLNKLILELVRHIVNLPAFTEEIGRDLGIDQLYWPKPASIEPDGNLAGIK